MLRNLSSDNLFCIRENLKKKSSGKDLYPFVHNSVREWFIQLRKIKKLYSNLVLSEYMVHVFYTSHGLVQTKRNNTFIVTYGVKTNVTRGGSHTYTGRISWSLSENRRSRRPWSFSWAVPPVRPDRPLSSLLASRCRLERDVLALRWSCWPLGQLSTMAHSQPEANNALIADQYGVWKATSFTDCENL